MKVAKHVPNEIIVIWERHKAKNLQLEIESLNSLAKLNKEEVHPESRPEWERQTKVVARAKLALEKIPLLFTQFENGIGPERFWKEIEKLENVTPWEFICNVTDAFVGNENVTDLMTEKNREVRKKKIKENASNLYSLVGGSNFNEYTRDRNEKLRLRLLETLKSNGVKVTSKLAYDINSTFSSDQYLVTDVLDHLINAEAERPSTLSSTNYDIQLPNPKRKEAARIYFAQRMTIFLGKRTGDPQRFLVRTLIDCLFGDSDNYIDDSKLKKLAPWE